MSNVDSIAAVSRLRHHLRVTLSALTDKDSDPIHETGSAVVSLLHQRPDAVRDLAYKKLNVYPFKDVPLCWRRAYEDACLWELLKSLESTIGSENFIEYHGHPSSKTVEHTAGEKREDVSLLRTWMDNAVQLCDRAIIFTGAPKRQQLINAVLDWIGERLNLDISIYALDESCNTAGTERRPIKRRRLSDNGKRSNDSAASMPPRFSPGSPAVPLMDPEHCIARLKCPSLSQFEAHVRDEAAPLIMTNTIDHWPARERWPDPNYWDAHTHGGRRLVPVELGRSYTDEGWGQKIVPFREFMQTYLLDGDGRNCHDIQASNGSNGVDAEQPIHSDNETKTPIIGYLAQHDLLSQIPALRSDIAIPDYCYADTPDTATSTLSASNSSPISTNNPDNEDNNNDNDNNDNDSPLPPAEPLLNIWLGPANTVSPAHTDPHHNILAQVFGRKYVRLFAPSETPCMYPMGSSSSSSSSNGNDDKEESDTSTDEAHRPGVDMGNTSRVDVGAFVAFLAGSTGCRNGEAKEDAEAQRRRFPRHATAAYVEAVLEAGECLYIPRGWWHYVRSLEPSCSVSFWWD